MTNTTETKTTSEVLVEMLTENTGTHFLDSGGTSGRAWQKNQGRDFHAEPATTLEWETGEWGGPMVTHSVYHFLLNALEYDPEMDALFAEFMATDADLYWLEGMEMFPQWLAENYGDEYGLRPGGHTVNTYNGEDSLTQVLQYHRFSMDNNGDDPYGDHVLLQIHGGADVRGGYTRPRAFTIDGSGYPDMFDNANAHIRCEEGHGWYTDDSTNWYPQNSEAISSLNPYQRAYGDEVVVSEVVEGAEHVAGKVVVRPDGVGLCPICGAPLSAGF